MDSSFVVDDSRILLHAGGGGGNQKRGHNKRRSSSQTDEKKKKVKQFVYDAQLKGGLPINRGRLRTFMSNMRQLLTPALTPTTLKVGEIGQLYEQMEGDFRDGWHSLAISRYHGYTVQHVKPPPDHLFRVLQKTIRQTVDAVQERLNAEGPYFRGTILHPLPRKRDLDKLHGAFKTLAIFMQHFKEGIICMNPRIRCRRQPVRWRDIVKSIHKIATIAQRSITPSKNPRIHMKTAVAHAESVVVGVSLRVGMMTALKVLHVMDELNHPHRYHKESTTPLDKTVDWSTSPLVSPMGDAKRDVDMERALRFMLHLSFRGGFGGSGWLFHGDSTMREAEESATSYRVLPRLRRLWRKGRRWIKTPMLSTISSELIKLIVSTVSASFISTHPVLHFAIVMMCRTFVGSVVRGVITSM